MNYTNSFPVVNDILAVFSDFFSAFACPVSVGLKGKIAHKTLYNPVIIN
jgi:hypothetical protein